MTILESSSALSPSRDNAHDLLTGAQLIAALLRRRGIRKIFAYPGTSELALCDAVLAAPGTDLVNSRGDKEAVFMAGGGNSLQANTCAAIVHGARGLTNALGAVADLRRSEVATLCIVGMASTTSARYLPPHAEPNLLTYAGGFARATFDCSDNTELDPEQFVKMVANAIRALDERPSGPVLLGVPQDLLATKLVPPELRDTEIVNDDQPPRRPVELTSAADLITHAERPLIMVDDYALQQAPEMSRILGAFGERIGAPVLQVAYRRGPMLFQQLQHPDVPTFLGLYEPSDPRHATLMQRTDLLVTIEDRNLYPRVVGDLGTSRKIALTSNTAATTKNGYLGDGDLIVEGDLSANLRWLTEHLPAHQLWTETEPPPHRHRHSVGSSPRELVSALASGLGTGRAAILVDDSQMFGGLIAEHYDLLPRGIKVLGSHGGFVGSGLAIAVGLSVSNPQLPVVCTLGDQGLTNAVQALSVAAGCKASLAIVVCNNGSSVSLRKQSSADGLSTATSGFLSNAEPMDYTAIAQGFGLTATKLVWPDLMGQLPESGAAKRIVAETIATALRTARPHLLELIVPAAPRFWSGVWRVNGLEGPSEVEHTS